MNPNKIEEDFFTQNHHHPQILELHHHHHHHHHHHPLDHLHSPTIDDPSHFSLSEIALFQHGVPDDCNEPASPCSSSSAANLVRPPVSYINPQPYVSPQFYNFNRDSHALMIRAIIENRLATPTEIRAATPPSILNSWRSVWKDRNEDTAYLTAWKRIQDKLSLHVDSNGNQFLCFKNNSQQFVSHIHQWQDIVFSFHCDSDLKHLGVKETIEKIKQVWTVGAKFYGIPESFIRVCVASCFICSGPSGSGGSTKRRRYEYTESIDVPAKEVPQRLQQLAAKHKVVLCIRQKYIRHKPFMAEVKDYACHRAGEPAAKKSRILKREPYASKRCGCGFRIRAILPISNYNEKDKTFVYEEEGMAVFKLYAVHSGHEPGPLDGNARIMHRMVGLKGGFLMDQDAVYGISEEDASNDDFELMGKDDGDLLISVVQQVQELRGEVGFLEGRLSKIPHELLGSVSDELFHVMNKVRSIGEAFSNPVNFISDKHEDTVDVLAHWGDHEQMYGKDTELMDEDEDIESFGRTLGDVATWEHMEAECRNQKDEINGNCKAEKWLKCSDFDEKSILNCEDSKLSKTIGHVDTIVTDVGLVGIQEENFYSENSKWYDSPCALDSGADCEDIV